ncbi:MAG: ABC transporter substrate-binding protein [Actinomycetota bacterium]
MIRGTRMRIGIALITTLATAGLAAGCGGDDDGGGDLGTLNEGALFIGIDTPYPPFAEGQPPNATGYDVEVLNAIAENIGLTTEYQDTGFPTIFRDVAAGQFDTAAAASSIKPGREKVVDFTDPYYLSATALVVPEGSDIATTDDLGGLIVGVQDATVQEEIANGTDAGEVRAFPEGTTALTALLTGQVEAVLVDEAVGADFLEKQGGVEIIVVESIPGDDLFGFAVAPDNDGLREAMNEALATIKEDGTMAELYQKYFDAEPPAKVLEGTNEDLTDD